MGSWLGHAELEQCTNERGHSPCDRLDVLVSRSGQLVGDLTAGLAAIESQDDGDEVCVDRGRERQTFVEDKGRRLRDVLPVPIDELLDQPVRLTHPNHAVEQRLLAGAARSRGGQEVEAAEDRLDVGSGRAATVSAQLETMEPRLAPAPSEDDGA